jgi:hypothetical protein
MRIVVRQAKLRALQQGERPCTSTPRRAGTEATGEVSRASPASHKSAEPVKAGCEGDLRSRRDPVSVSVKESSCEPMMEASSEHGARQLGGRRVGVMPVDRWTALTIAERGGRGSRASTLGKVLRAPRVKFHTGYSRLLKRTRECVRNLGTSSRPPWRLAPRMIETADDRGDEGRNLRSSPRAGKPLAWRRKVVDAVSRQEAGACPAR